MFASEFVEKLMITNLILFYYYFLATINHLNKMVQKQEMEINRLQVFLVHTQCACISDFLEIFKPMHQDFKKVRSNEEFFFQI